MDSFSSDGVALYDGSVHMKSARSGEIKMKTVFITHASVDRPLALLMKQLISNTFQVGKQSLSCFCSSDIGDIEAGSTGSIKYLKNFGKRTFVLQS